MDQQPSGASATTMESLLLLHDEAFVASAYQAILGRTPDLGGMQNYLAQIRAGTDKALILVELAGSPEAKAKSPLSRTLINAIAAYSMRNSSVWRRLFRRISGAFAGSVELQLRRIENQLYVIERGTARQNRQLAELLAYVMSISSETSKADISPSDSAEGHSIDGAGQGGIASGPTRTFLELKSAIALKQTT